MRIVSFRRDDGAERFGVVDGDVVRDAGVELTQLGSGAIRLQQQPGGSSLDSSDVAPTADWLGAAGASWPTKLRIGEPGISFCV